MTETTWWRECSACKKPIAYGAKYSVCNVSTCNRKRTGMVFCSVECWEVHLPLANHREAWSIEETAPRETVARGNAPSGDRAGGAQPPSKAPAGSAPPGEISARAGMSDRESRPAPGSTRTPPPPEVLIIASRLKDYIRAKAGFNTSDRVLEPLSELVRTICDRAIANAARDERRTVLDRDIPSD